MGGNNLTGASTRLDGLLALLESGSNPAVRAMAASQIGHLVAAHPSETRPVLRRVRRLLRSSVWEARIAAGQAIAAIADHSPRFLPISPTKPEPTTLPTSAAPPYKIEPTTTTSSNAHATASDPSFILEAGLQLHSFQLQTLLHHGAMLFASAGDEFNHAQADIATQRARLKADLGLDDKFSTAPGGGPENLARIGLDDADLVTRPSAHSSSDLSLNGDDPRRDTADFVAEMSASGLSARERNRLKRLAKRKAKEGVDMAPSKRPRTSDPQSTSPEAFSLAGLASPNDPDADIEAKFAEAYWDFQPTCEVLKEGLLLEKWEWRHGAAIGLRQVLMRHPHSAGRKSPGQLGDQENERWLEDLCCRLLCVLAMDRFGDFVGDAVVAPVREAAAMTIGAAARVMSVDLTERLLERLLHLLSPTAATQWEVRHAALLGTRYVLAVKGDSVPQLLNMTFDSISDKLQDADDDVRAVAAEALLPIVQHMIQAIPQRVPRLVSKLWEALLDLDDICASTSSIMKLLSEIVSHPSASGCNHLWLESNILSDNSDGEEIDSSAKQSSSFNASAILTELVPRLWPFFRHSSKGVRRASMNLLETLSSNLSEDQLVQLVVPLSNDLFTRLFRNILLETESDILCTSQRAWERFLEAFGKRRQLSQEFVQTFSPLIRHWIRTASQETRTEAASFDEAQHRPKVRAAASRRKAAAARRAAKARKTKQARGLIPSSSYDTDASPAAEGPFDAAIMQRNAAVALGYLAVFWPSDDATCENCIVEALQGNFGIARRLACDILQQWAERSSYEAFVFSDRTKELLNREVMTDGSHFFAEIGSSVGSFFTDTLSFLDNMPVSLNPLGLDVCSLQSTAVEGKKTFTSGDATMAAACAHSLKPKMYLLVTGDGWEYISRSLRSGAVHQRIAEGVTSLRMRLLTSLGYMDSRADNIKVSLAASATSALVCAKGISLPQKVGPMIRSLTAAIRTMENPFIQLHAATTVSVLALRLCKREPQKPLVLMLKNLIKYLTNPDGDQEKDIFAFTSGNSNIKLQGVALAKRGGLLSMKQLCLTFKDSLFSSLPSMWARIADPLTSTNFASVSPDVRDAMIILRAIVPYVHASLHPITATMFPKLVLACTSPHEGYANDAPRCLADAVAAISSQGMQTVVSDLVPLLAGSQQDKNADRYARRGAAKALQLIVEKMGTSIIPYAAFMVVPMMTRMVDEDDVVRDSAAGVFGTLIRLMPLEGGAPDDPEMSASFAAERQTARSFLSQLLGTEPRHHYELPVQIADDIVLRKYQQECLDWLAFLNRYGLHGALCDDMGLGKTLMTLCMVAGDYFVSSNQGRPLPSLVVCPSTIVAHWVMEAERFFGHVLSSIVQYSGPPKTRAQIRGRASMQSAAVIVTSYEILSNDLRFFECYRWNYLVLDEGHVIKNAKTKVAKAVRALSADHRLILTGTPIQNSVLELWAMFDFLMPGFLGTEKGFKEQYAKPIMASRDSKCSEIDHEKGLAATESLHRQVLPFILRRLKDDVLSELPPKIMQDYFCKLTPLQLRLYEDFVSDVAQGGNALDMGEGDDGAGAKEKGGGHTFKALSYLRRLCSHPKLVLTSSHPELHSVQRALAAQGKSINDISSSSKLVGLKNILTECGIGTGDVAGGKSGGHRALIFAQLKQMLDVVEVDLFQNHMPDVSYLRLDGSVEASKRQPIVTRFNADPTIDCLLLTTHVGGLGLNLTGADTVIFLEHDWNPTKDLQAMDRAHRMGQKRTVNVYRLITRGTLEEKIMSIQQFKTHIANTVVNRENSTLQSMNTEQLLDLFKVEKDAVASDEGNDDLALGTGKGMKAALAGLGDLWEESQYEDEYNMESFLAGMKGPNDKT